MAENENTNEIDSRPEPVDLSGYKSEVEWLRNELKNTRGEAAKYRTERNEAREQIKGMTSIEEVQALQTKLTDMERKATHDRLVLTYANELPEALRESVNWPEDEAGIKAKAEELSAFTFQPPGNNSVPSGGLGDRGQDNNDDFDPAALAAEIPR